MKIILKGTPPSLNRFAGRANSWEYRAEKERWTRSVRAACLSKREKSPGREKIYLARENAPEAASGPRDAMRAQKLAHVRIDYFFPDARRRDPDNYCGKFLLDGLTKAGEIADDDFAHIALEVHGHVDRKNPRTEITVEHDDQRAAEPSD